MAGLAPCGETLTCFVQVTKDKGIGSSVVFFLKTLPQGDTSGQIFGDWVDVRDTSAHHVLALSTPEAGNERISSVARTSIIFVQRIRNHLLTLELCGAQMPLLGKISTTF